MRKYPGSGEFLTAPEVKREAQLGLRLDNGSDFLRLAFESEDTRSRTEEGTNDDRSK